MKAYRALAARYGLRYRFTKTIPERNWTGGGLIRLCYGVGGPDSDMPAHELAHYLVATPNERALAEWGLGPSPVAFSTHVEEVVADSHIVEGRASLLGIFIQRWMEDKEVAAETFDNHNWNSGGAVQVARTLLEDGFLVWHKNRLMPRCLVKAPRKKEIFHGREVRRAG